MRKPPIDNGIALYLGKKWKLLLDRNSLVDRHVIEAGQWEADQMGYLFALCEGLSERNDAVFLDIGAYCGLYSMRAVATGLFSEIHAFEADRRNIGQLYGNIFVNELEDMIVVHHIAVSDHIGEVAFKDSSTLRDNRGGAGIEPDASSSTVTLPCAPLDSLLSFRDKNIVVKLDVEKHEPQVLRGMKTLLQLNRVILQVEAFDDTKDALYATAEELGLKHLKSIHVDHYFANFDLDKASEREGGNSVS